MDRRNKCGDDGVVSIAVKNRAAACAEKASVTTGLVPVVHADVDRRNKCGDDGVVSIVVKNRAAASQKKPLSQPGLSRWSTRTRIAVTSTAMTIL